MKLMNIKFNIKLLCLSALCALFLTAPISLSSVSALFTPQFAPQKGVSVGSVGSLELSEVSAKPKKRKRYDRLQRKAQAMIKEGHPTVELSVRTSPRVSARVYHGKELLGVAPFTFKWPKDTGALDLVLKAPGYIRVNTRLYTYRDDKVTVDMFKETEAHKLFGYKKKIEAPSAEDLEEGE